MEIASTALPDVLLIKPKVWSDARGFFMEGWNEKVFRDAGLDIHFCQDNHSRSSRNVLRGLHYQLNPPQGKLVRCIRGAIFDVAVDLRRSATTFRRWVGIELSDTNHHSLWIPPGFAHGFFVLTDIADVVYKTTAPYDAGSDRAVAWSDPGLAIDWPLNGASPVLSAKDARAKRADEAELFD